MQNKPDKQEKKSVAEIAALFQVSIPAVHYWIKKGLQTETQKILGRKDRAVIRISDVENHLGIKLEEI